MTIVYLRTHNDARSKPILLNFKQFEQRRFVCAILARIWTVEWAFIRCFDIRLTDISVNGRQADLTLPILALPMT